MYQTIRKIALVGTLRVPKAHIFGVRMVRHVYTSIDLPSLYRNLSAKHEK